MSGRLLESLFLNFYIFTPRLKWFTPYCLLNYLWLFICLILIKLIKIGLNFVKLPIFFFQNYGFHIWFGLARLCWTYCANKGWHGRSHFKECNTWYASMQLIWIESAILWKFRVHNAPSGLWMKLKILSTGPWQGERACIRGSEYTLFKILN